MSRSNVLNSVNLSLDLVSLMSFLLTNTAVLG
jgi:hypothetical protein